MTYRTQILASSLLLTIASTVAAVAQTPPLTRRSPYDTLIQNLSDFSGAKPQPQPAMTPATAPTNTTYSSTSTSPATAVSAFTIAFEPEMWVEIRPGVSTSIPGGSNVAAPLPNVYQIGKVDSAGYHLQGGTIDPIETTVQIDSIVPIKETLQKLTGMIKQYPVDARFLASRGLVEMGVGGVREAIADLDQALRLDPKNARYFYYRGLAHGKAGADQRALGDLFEAIRLDPRVPDFYSARALAALKRGDKRRAIDDYTQTLLLRPADLKALLGRADARLDHTLLLSAQLEYKKAVDDCRQALRYAPDDADALNLLASAYFKLGDYPSAIEVFTQLALTHPDDIRALLGRACSFYWNSSKEISDNDRAVTDYNTVLQIAAPKSGAAFNALKGRGTVHSFQKKNQEAIDDFTKALAIKPDDDYVLSLRVRVLKDSHRWREALEDYTKLNEGDRDDLTVLVARADVNATLARFVEAIDDYTDAIRRNVARIPDLHLHALLGRAVAYRHRGKWARAAQDYKDVLKLNPDNQTAEDGLLWLEARTKPPATVPTGSAPPAAPSPTAAPTPISVPATITVAFPVQVAISPPTSVTVTASTAPTAKAAGSSTPKTEKKDDTPKPKP